MTHLFRRSLIAATLALPALALANAAVEAPAPAFTAQTADGKTVNLSDFKGKTVVLEWTNHDCPYVKKHYGSGNMQSQQKAAAAQGVVWLQVISSAPGQQGFVDGPTAKKLNADRGAAPTATLLDPKGELGKLYGAQTTPHMYVIKGDGTLAYKGGIDSIASAKAEDIAKAEPYVADALAAVAAGRKVEKASTRPYGCSVKYAS
ncbi:MULTISPECIES: redoxin domain-containing protein [Burkholderiales]|jgi:peroxiredoxin|uniref:Thioredoxin family protein n=1 Tax=Roseateles puraquae TaxID=431059 RepID=A0A254N9R1_9BURK|nr:redoxin domain-containing protein [Roseateles puraquae]MDG0853919.1 redoxin domain-containing protein [Roseateles puraquae]OWR04751.1 thioredoxin family protein [Roseateles puraquae]